MLTCWPKLAKDGRWWEDFPWDFAISKFRNQVTLWRWRPLQVQSRPPGGTNSRTDHKSQIVTLWIAKRHPITTVWWFQPLWKNISQLERIIPYISYIMENKKCSKPPTRPNFWGKATDEVETDTTVGSEALITFFPFRARPSWTTLPKAVALLSALGWLKHSLQKPCSHAMCSPCELWVKHGKALWWSERPGYTIL